MSDLRKVWNVDWEDLDWWFELKRDYRSGKFGWVGKWGGSGNVRRNLELWSEWFEFMVDVGWVIQIQKGGD